MAIKILETDKLKWVNIDHVDEDAIVYLKENHNFHHLDLDDVQGESQTPKLDTYKNYLFLIVHFPHWNAETRTMINHELNIFVGDGYLITIQHTRSKEMKNFFYRCMKRKSVKKEWMSHTSGFLLYKLLEATFKNVQPILNQIGKELSQIEHDIFTEEQDVQIVKRLAEHRRNVLNISRIIDPQRYIIASFAHIRKSFMNEETALYFDNVNDYLNKIWAILDTYKDTIQGLHVTVESLITQKTNKVIGVLTVISVGLLPFTVLASIYGMNIAGLPYAQDPVWVWAMFAGLGAIIVCIIGLLKWKNWF